MITLHLVDGTAKEFAWSQIKRAQSCYISPAKAMIFLSKTEFIHVKESVSQIKKLYKREIAGLKEIQEELPL